MSILLRKLIKELISEALPSQHPMFRSNDLGEIGERLTNRLENLGFKISKSSTQFNNVCTFEIEKGRVYLVTVKKISKNHITEDSSVEFFRRDDPELAAFLKKMGNKNYAARLSTPRQKKQEPDSQDGDQLLYDENDDTIHASDREVFKFKTKVTYLVHVYDKGKNGNTVFDFKQNFITSSGKDPTVDDDFDYFADELCDSVIRSLKSL